MALEDIFGFEPGEYLSPLDHWTLKEFNVLADQIDPDKHEQLVQRVLTLADHDELYWSPRNRRMMEDQRFWEQRRQYGLKQGSLKPASEDEETSESETVELNDGYLTVDKIVSMGSGASFSIEVPPSKTQLTDTSQKIENFLRFLDQELNARHGLALNSSLSRDEWHYAALRGWLCGVVTPDPTNPRVPIDYTLEDPMFVFPRYSRKKMIRVIHRYTIKILEARDEFPESFEFLFDRDEDDDITVTTYYDEKYKITVLGESAGQQGSRGAMGISPLVRHGYVDVDGQPINPWIIVTPRGTPTRSSSSEHSTVADQDRVVENIGLGVLHPIKGMIERLEKLAGQLHTEVAKGVNPPHIVYYDGVNKPELLDLGIGSENYLILGQQEYEAINTSAMKPDIEPLMNMYTERLQKGSIPSVLYGDTPGGGISGYAINLLSQGARDVVGPLIDGIKLFREMKYRRMLEMYLSVGSQWMPQMPFVYPNDNMEYQTDVITPEEIRANGVYVIVNFEDLVPQDRAGMISVAAQGVSAGVLPLYDALKDWVGLKDAKAALTRIAEGANYKDPEIIKEMALIAAEQSGNELLMEAARRVQMRQMIMMQQQMLASMGGENAQGSKTEPGGLPSQVVPPNQQGEQNRSVPSNIDPMNAVLQQQRQVGATANMANGANGPSNSDQDLTRLFQALGV